MYVCMYVCISHLTSALRERADSYAARVCPPPGSSSRIGPVGLGPPDPGGKNEPAEAEKPAAGGA